MLKWYIKGTLLRFSTNYSTVIIKISCAPKIEKFINHKNFVIVSFW